MNFGDRPGEWLGYAPGESPNRLVGGPNSPKKKTMNWRVARDMQLSQKEEEEQQQQKDGDSSAIKVATEEEKPAASLPPPAPVELDSSVGSDEEEIIEELVVDEDGPVFDVVEYEDDDDDGSEYEEEVLEDSDESSNQGDGAGAGGNEDQEGGSDRTDEDSMFDPLPPPIEIPNALKPVHMRQSEQKSSVLASKQEDSSSDDDSTDSDNETEQKQVVSSLRPGTLRGHSNDGLENMGSQVRRGKRSESSNKKTDDDAVEEMIKEAPRVAPTSVRPSVVRGHSCEDDIQAMNEAVQVSRGGKRPEKPSDDKQEDAVPSPSKMDATSPPVSPLRPGTVRGHSFDREIEDMSKAARGGKKPEKIADEKGESPSTPTQGSKPGYHSLRKDVSTTTPTRSKTPTRVAAPTTPTTPSRRGEDTAPPVPSYTRVDDNGVEHKEYTWEKPAWATRSPLKTTAKGDKLKQGSDLARPIGGIKPVP